MVSALQTRCAELRQGLKDCPPLLLLQSSNAGCAAGAVLERMANIMPERSIHEGLQMAYVDVTRSTRRIVLKTNLP
jgi:hypothetical protein